MRIAINAMQVRAAKSGVGQYIHGLLGALLETTEEDNYTVYCTRLNEVNYQYDNRRCQTRVWGLSDFPRPVRLLNEYARLPGEIKAAGFDLLHGPSNFLPPRRVCPYVVTIHDLSYYVHPDRCPPVRRRYWYAMTTSSVRAADIILCPSNHTAGDIAKYFPGAASKIRVAHNGVHPRFRPLRDPGELYLNGQPFILHVATLEPGKNTVRIIEAFEMIADRHPKVQLILAGDKGWLYEQILERMAASQMAHRIHYLGHVTDDEVVRLYNQCSLFVFPSLYEGFGLPPLEAMACGAPVVTSNSSSIPEVVGGAAIQIDPTQSDEIAGGMHKLLSDHALADDYSRRGIEQAARFTWTESARLTTQAYYEAAKQG